MHCSSSPDWPWDERAISVDVVVDEVIKEQAGLLGSEDSEVMFRDQLNHELFELSKARMHPGLEK